tara:strand:- start:85 stop:291 length:207 start_codon:yes stop_codon:yes gene_type:complete
MFKVSKETQISVGHSIVTYSEGEHKSLPKEAIDKLTKIGVLEKAKAKAKAKADVVAVPDAALADADAE